MAYAMVCTRKKNTVYVSKVTVEIRLFHACTLNHIHIYDKSYHVDNP